MDDYTLVTIAVRRYAEDLRRDVEYCKKYGLEGLIPSKEAELKDCESFLQRMDNEEIDL